MIDSRFGKGAISQVAGIRSIAEQFILMIVDLLLLIAIFKIAVLIRLHILTYFSEAFIRYLPFKSIYDVWWIYLVWLFFFAYGGIYTRMLSFWSEIRALVIASLFSTTGVFVIVSVGKLSDEVSRTVIILMGLLAILLLPVFHILAKRCLKIFGFFKRRVLILGTGRRGQWIRDAIMGEQNFNYKICGFLDDDPSRPGSAIDGVNVLGTISDTRKVIESHGITDLYIAIPGVGSNRIQELVNNLQHMVDRTFIVSDITGIAVLGTRLHQFENEQAFALEVQNNLASPLSVLIKRSMDLAGSLILIPILSIPMAIIAAFIRIDSRGPAILSQERIGRRGTTFKCFKFRTMHTNADEILEGLIQNDPAIKKEWEEGWKLKDDPRVTRIGLFLRKAYLDELPQILNVFIGNMSLVGPRPYLPRELVSIMNYADKILLPKPGITGLWQVSGHQSNEYRIYLDMWYVRNWNLWLDITIILKTIKILIIPSSSPYRR